MTIGSPANIGSFIENAVAVSSITHSASRSGDISCVVALISRATWILCSTLLKAPKRSRNQVQIASPPSKVVPLLLGNWQLGEYQSWKGAEKASESTLLLDFSI